MGFPQLRRFDVQAKYSLILSLISILPLLGAAALALRNYDHELGQIVYGATGLFLPLFLACVALSGATGATGFMLGLSSAGQRRNEKPAWSWIGFIVGGTAVTFDIVLLIAYWMLKFKQPG